MLTTKVSTNVRNPVLALAEAIQAEQPAVLATVVAVSGASPAKLGAQIVLRQDGTTIGTVGGGKLENTILADARALLKTRRSILKHYSLTETGEHAVGVLCGGEVMVFIQSYTPPPRLVIVGGGHIGQPLKAMAEVAGFTTLVVDVDPERGAVPDLAECVLDPDTYIVLITTDHICDEAALRQVIDSPVPYIGMIGSRAKCQSILDHLRADGYSDASLARVHAPVGLNLGGPSPAEIAVAILAEIIAVRWGGSCEMKSHQRASMG